MPLPAINIFTDLSPDALTEIGLTVYLKWVSFALGQSDINGKVLMHPTGRYASSISFKKFSRSHIAIIADENFAPEGAVLEKGHGPIDLKNYLRKGQAYPMHRGEAGSFGSAGYGNPVFAATGRSRRSGKQRNIWGQIRAGGFSGFASVGETGWVIPSMPAYSPAAHLAEIAKDMAGVQV
jgi:hypothetical protein